MAAEAPPLKPWTGQLVALPPIGAAVRDVLARPACIPNGTVVLSALSEHHRKLRSLALLRAQRCLTSRLVTACYGLSANEAHGTCVSAPAVRRTSFGGAASSYTRGVVEPYFELVWVKWRLLLAALQEGGARAALWLDADVVLFRNPWELHPALGSASYDIRYQSEFACAGPCASVDQPTAYRLPSHRAAHPKPVESMGSWAEAEGPPTPA